MTFSDFMLYEIILYSFFFFFFFNDPPPTEFSPLPLPAPLPIGAAAARHPRFAAACLSRGRQGAGGVDDRREPALVHVPGRPAHPPASEARRAGEEERGLHLDRKSTRLNSSHLVNSYAVFCFKKK